MIATKIRWGVATFAAEHCALRLIIPVSVAVGKPAITAAKPARKKIAIQSLATVASPFTCNAIIHWRCKGGANKGYNEMANDDIAARVLAQEGLRHIEQAILMLLEANPQGLRNSQIADVLGLRSSIRNGQRNYLTYSVLGGLMARGEIVQDRETKIFTRSETAT